jgi:hypothetical protein
VAKLEYEIVVRGADNGVVVNIGCKTLVFMNGIPLLEFMEDFKEYVTGGRGSFVKLHNKYFGEISKDIGCDVRPPEPTNYPAEERYR